MLALQLPPSWQNLSIAIEQCEHAIDSLWYTQVFAIILMVLVVFAGAASSVLQLSKSDRYKILVGICGVTTAALTTVSGLIFPISAKEMSDRVSKASSEIRLAINYMAMYELPVSGDEKIYHLKQVNQRLDNVEKIINGITPPGSLAQSAWDFTNSAHADQNIGDPTWFKDFPRQDAYLYFIGIGVSDSLQTARDDSIANAKQEAQRSILDKLPASEDSSKITKILSDSGSIADTDFKFDESNNRKLYTYSTLFAIRTRDFNYYLSSTGVDITNEFIRVQKSADYFNTRWRTYAYALDVARDELSDSDYDALLAGRNARKNQDQVKCIEILKPVIKHGDPAWYLGWFNIGLAYWSLGKKLEAKQAFLEAVALEPNLPERDPSIYNSFGQFYVETYEYDKAEILLKRALELNPNISGAEYALKVAREQAPSSSMVGEQSR